jgi:hypothetical protein
VREHDKLCTVTRADLDHGAVHVRLDGGGAQDEARGDLLVGQPGRDEGGGLPFPVGQ